MNKLKQELIDLKKQSLKIQGDIFSKRIEIQRRVIKLDEKLLNKEQTY